MKKYKVVKCLALCVAIFAVICFFTPFAYEQDIVWGFNFLIGSKPNRYGMHSDYTYEILGAWRAYTVITWLSFIIAITALVLAVLSLMSTDANGLNKQGKMHKSLLISVGLSLLSAFLNLVIMLVGMNVPYLKSTSTMGSRVQYWTLDMPYTFIGLIPIVIVTIVIVLLLIKAKSEIATAEGAPQDEKSEAGEGQKKDKPKSGFFKQWKRSKGAIYGDIEGPVTKLKRGRMSIAYEDGKFIAFLLGAGEFELSKENVERLELIEENVPCENIANMFGVKKEIDRYKIVMKDGQVGTLRLVHEIADAVVGLLCGDSDEAEETSDMDELDDETKAALTFFQKAAESPDSPIGKSLDWFQSEKGLEVYKVYTAPRNFILQSRYVQEFKKMFAGEKSNVDFDRHFLPVTYPDAKLPRTYYKALLESLGAEAVKNNVVLAFLLDTLLSISIPYTLDEDGEPIPRDTALIPEQFVSAEKNPLLYFVKNFNVFKFEHDDLGHLAEKFIIYRAAVSCILPFVVSNNKVDIQWLLDKDTYINEFGVLRKLKGFIKKCKEHTDNAEYHQYLDELLKKFLAEMESDKKE